MQQFYSLMRKETTTICFGSMFAVISAVCERSEESDRVGGFLSQAAEVRNKFNSGEKSSLSLVTISLYIYKIYWL